MTRSSSQPRLSYRTTFAPNSFSDDKKSPFPLAFVEGLNNNEANIEDIFIASIPQNSKAYKMKRKLLLYLVTTIRIKSYSDVYSAFLGTEPVKMKRKAEIHSIPLDVETWKRKLSLWKSLHGYDGRIGHECKPHEHNG